MCKEGDLFTEIVKTLKSNDMSFHEGLCEREHVYCVDKLLFHSMQVVKG